MQRVGSWIWEQLGKITGHGCSRQRQWQRTLVEYEAAWPADDRPDVPPAYTGAVRELPGIAGWWPHQYGVPNTEKKN